MTSVFSGFFSCRQAGRYLYVAQPTGAMFARLMAAGGGGSCVPTLPVMWLRRSGLHAPTAGALAYPLPTGRMCRLQVLLRQLCRQMRGWGETKTAVEMAQPHSMATACHVGFKAQSRQMGRLAHMTFGYRRSWSRQPPPSCAALPPLLPPPPPLQCKLQIGRAHV